MSVKNTSQNRGGEVLKAGFLKKLKTSRKKWFVLRAETPESSARLEYYDSEKKFNSGQQPKRSIPLKTCFNINKRCDTKYKHVIALYTKDDRFCIVLDNEEELDSWLKSLLSLQLGEETPDGEMPRPTFEHVWQVAILNRGLGTGRIGKYRLCLTDKTLTLIKNDETSHIDLNLSNIRSCGSLKNYFFLEIGRSSQLGAGELWMESEDANIASNIHTTIFHAMSTNTNRDDLGPKTRNRSSSDTSKPNNSTGSVNRKPGVPKPHLFSQDSHVTSTTSTTPTTSVVTVVHAPPTTAVPASPHTGSSSVIISHQRTQSLPLTDHPPTAPLSDNTIHQRGNGTGVKRPSQSGNKCILAHRERCDSMPSRPRTNSEGPQHQLPSWRLIPHRPTHHTRDIAHSPTSGGSPVSPPSVSDSTGSSYSLADEVDGCTDFCEQGVRYAVTPDEPIQEEDCTMESPCKYNHRFTIPQPQGSDDGYVDMHPNGAHSPTASMSSITSGTPSTDMRFSDYPLDKVSSYFPSEDDDDRPARAYSVGSRPETCKNRRHMELAGTPDARARAFSVGSRTKKGPSRVLPPHHPHHGTKSNSAPMLSNSRTYSSHSSIQSSIGPMDDLMEMDFSRSNTGSSTNSGYLEMKPGPVQHNNNTKNHSGYVEMKPGVDLSQKRTTSNSETSPYVDMSSGTTSAYMDMSGSSPSRNAASSPHEEYGLFVDINRQYRMMNNDHQPRNNNYVDMDHRRSKTTNRSSINSWSGGDYLDMTGGNHQRQHHNSNLSSSPTVTTSPNNQSDYMPLSFYQQDTNKINENQKTPEGYVEMTLGSKKHQRQPSLEYAQMGGSNHNEDYTNMSVGIATKKKSSKKSSQPISILPTTTSSQVTKNSSSPISISSLLGRKPSVGTPPKMHLPLGSYSPYSSLPRQRNRKDSHTNSKDSSSSSVTTPSSSSTIFPMSLNSPSSPMKPLKAETPASSKLPAAIFNAIYKNNKKVTNDEDYTEMDFEVNKAKNCSSDYVNYCPGAPKPAPLRTPQPEPMDDYAIMQPGVLETVKVTTLPVKSISSDGGASPLIGHLSSIGIKENQSMCFRPIKEDAKFEETSKKSEDTKQGDIDPPYETLRGTECVSPAAKMSRPNSVNSDNTKNTSPRSLNEKSRPASVSSDSSKNTISRPSSVSSEQWSSSSTLVGSRPESVNSDAIQTDSTSSNSAKLHYASLDLAQSQDEEDSRSPRPVKTSPENQPEPTFVYAEIDFVMSEGLKQSNQSLPTNTKVKH